MNEHRQRERHKRCRSRSGQEEEYSRNDAADELHRYFGSEILGDEGRLLLIAG
jgi:hypothetical protein